MRKIFFIVAMFVCSFCFVGLVNADYAETDWTNSGCLPAPEGGLDENFEIPLGAAYDNYSFDKTTGKFSVSGNLYTSAPAETRNNGVYYVLLTDNSEVVTGIKAYVINVDAATYAKYNIDNVGSNFYCMAEKSFTQVTAPTPTKPDNDNPAEPTNDNEFDNEDEDEDDDDNTYYMSGNDGSSSSNGSYGTYSSNPNTGVSDYIMYLLPVLLIGGSTLVFRKRFN